RVEDNLAAAVREAGTAHERARDDPPPPLRSVLTPPPPPPPARAAGAPPAPTPPPREWDDQLELFLTARAAALANPKEADKAKELRKEFVDKTKARRADAAALIWRRLVNDPSPKAETVAELSALLDEVQPAATA